MIFYVTFKYNETYQTDVQVLLFLKTHGHVSFEQTFSFTTKNEEKRGNLYDYNFAGDD